MCEVKWTSVDVDTPPTHCPRLACIGGTNGTCFMMTWDGENWRHEDNTICRRKVTHWTDPRQFAPTAEYKAGQLVRLRNGDMIVLTDHDSEEYPLGSAGDSWRMDGTYSAYGCEHKYDIVEIVLEPEELQQCIHR